MKNVPLSGNMNPCRCGNLDKFARDPKIPIEFDKKTGNYFLHLTIEKREKISCCFICGGHAVSKVEQKCKCKQLNTWSKIQNSCIRYNVGLDEYHLVYGDGCKLIFHYCPKCGGHLPKSKRNQLFQKPSKVERLKLQKKIEGVKTFEQITDIFGEPDEHDAGIKFDQKEQEIYGAKGITRLMRYARLAKTLDVVVQELEDGTLQTFFVPKSKSP